MVLFCFADAPGTYWPFVFPGLALGSAGAMLAYTHTRCVFLLSHCTMCAAG